MSFISKLIGMGGGPPAKKRVYLCTGPDCCDLETGQEAYRYLKRRLRELGLSEGEKRIECRRAECMNVCDNGPVGAVYPDGRFYRPLTQENIERLIRENLMEGRPVEELAFDPPEDVVKPE